MSAPFFGRTRSIWPWRQVSRLAALVAACFTGKPTFALIRPSAARPAVPRFYCARHDLPLSRDAIRTGKNIRYGKVQHSWLSCDNHGSGTSTIDSGIRSRLYGRTRNPSPSLLDSRCRCFCITCTFRHCIYFVVICSPILFCRGLHSIALYQQKVRNEHQIAVLTQSDNWAAT
jgi:hypothetical protein